MIQLNSLFIIKEDDLYMKDYWDLKKSLLNGFEDPYIFKLVTITNEPNRPNKKVIMITWKNIYIL
jgi:hypothetical protein